jgi:hypothetical protein
MMIVNANARQFQRGVSCALECGRLPPLSECSRQALSESGKPPHSKALRRAENQSA